MPKRHPLRLTLPILAVAVLAPLPMTGCLSTTAFRNDPTPDIRTHKQTEDDVLNQLTVTADTNFRLLNDDMGRFWLSDRPSRLTRGPKPY